MSVFFTSIVFAAALPKIGNVSCRNPVSDAVPFIGGFTIQSRHKFLIRAVGPGLKGFAVSNFCRDPMLRVFQGDKLLATNDNWDGANDIRAEAIQRGAFPLVNGSKDAAILITLDEGSYTAVITCADGSEGITLLEIYDIDWKKGDGITNLSMRGMAGSGERMMISGIIVEEQALATYLFRAIGPGLEQFDIQGFLIDPLVTLSTSKGVMYAWNDDWPGLFTNFYFQSKGAFSLPTGSKDAVLRSGTSPFAPTPDFLNVAAGSKDGQSGIVLFEFYMFPDD